MSEETKIPPITDSTRRLLLDLEKYKFPPKEQTLFSVGGRGYYENPTSDLLRFFMSPSEGHDLGPLFLQAFFACLGEKSPDPPSFEGVTVWREVRTKDDCRIDLLIAGKDWVLVIENKIRHWRANDFSLYEEHARHHAGGKKIYLAILSPEGEENAAQDKWTEVTYKAYCCALRREFAKSIFDRSLSKWQVFAREFVVHLENELYNLFMTMTSEQIAFVEMNLRGLEEAKKLSEGYMAFLAGDLAERLREAVPEYRFEFKNEKWALACNDIHERWCFTFQTPTQAGNSECKFIVGLWLRAPLNVALLQRAGDVVNGFAKSTFQEGGQWWESSYITRAETVDGLVKLAKRLFDFMGTEIPPAPLS